MKGQILGFDGNSGAISGEDGQRYSFTVADWKGERTPQPRDSVDFVGTGGIATEIYPTGTAFGAALSGFGEGLKGAQAEGGREMIASRPQVVLEVLALLIALLFPYLSTTFGSGATMVNVASGAGNMSSVGGGLGFLVVLAYLFWLVPIGALAAIFLDFTGRRDKRIELALGALCIFALIYYFLLQHAIASAAGPFGAMAASIISLGFGGYLIVLVGAGLIATGLGKLTRIPGM